METETGRTRWFNSSKRYGFIAPSNGGTDLFFHGSVLSDIDSDAMDGGGENIAVSFERGVSKRDGRPLAINVRIIDEEDGNHV